MPHSHQTGKTGLADWTKGGFGGKLEG